MAYASKIEWTQTTWNPVVGCTKVSAGCANCYAERMARRLAAMARADLAAGRDPGRKAHYLHVVDKGGWNGQLRLDHDVLAEPGRWASPRLVFVNSMSDLFHADVPESFIGAVIAAIGAAPRHTFQVLTKRAERAAAVCAGLTLPPNLWLGVSVENAKVASRVDHLRGIAAIVRFLSVEPMLGPLPGLDLAGIHWVICGGESGPGARPIRPEWVRDLRDQCQQGRVPFFFKQWGGVNKHRQGRELDNAVWNQWPHPEPGRIDDAEKLLHEGTRTP